MHITKNIVVVVVIGSSNDVTTTNTNHHLQKFSHFLAAATKISLQSVTKKPYSHLKQEQNVLLGYCVVTDQQIKMLIHTVRRRGLLVTMFVQLPSSMVVANRKRKGERRAKEDGSLEKK